MGKTSKKVIESSSDSDSENTEEVIAKSKKTKQDQEET